MEYIVELHQPLHGTTCFGNSLDEKDQDNATRFTGYYEAVRQLAAVLADHVLHEPVEIRIFPALNTDPWTLEEILAREG